MQEGTKEFETSEEAVYASAAQDGAAEVPLCVDLDGTLVKSDTLVDAVLLLVRQQPASPLQWPGGSGKVALASSVKSLIAP